MPFFSIAIVLAYQVPYAFTHCNGLFHIPLYGFGVSICRRGS